MSRLLKGLMIASLFFASMNFTSCDGNDSTTGVKAGDEASSSSQNGGPSISIKSSSSIIAVTVSSSSVKNDRSSSSYTCEEGRIQYLTLSGVRVYYICEGDTWVAMPASSSSTAANSSNSVILSFGKFQDVRDKQFYKSVTINSQTWMAQNLNYADSEATTSLKGGNWCYGNSTDSCAKYGRLYTWTTAMRLDTVYQDSYSGFVIQSPHHGNCPIGWHLPDSTEWRKLMLVVSENNHGEDVGTSLKSTMGWNPDSGSVTGSDLFGFSALPAGARGTKNFYDAGSSTCFWISNEVDDRSLGLIISIVSNYWEPFEKAFIYMCRNYKTAACSVRCIKD